MRDKNDGDLKDSEESTGDGVKVGGGSTLGEVEVSSKKLKSVQHEVIDVNHEEEDSDKDLHAEESEDEDEEEEEEEEGEDGGDGVGQGQHKVSQARPVPDSNLMLNNEHHCQTSIAT